MHRKKRWGGGKHRWLIDSRAFLSVLKGLWAPLLACSSLSLHKAEGKGTLGGNCSALHTIGFQGSSAPANMAKGQHVRERRATNSPVLLQTLGTPALFSGICESFPFVALSVQHIKCSQKPAFIPKYIYQRVQHIWQSSFPANSTSSQAETSWGSLFKSSTQRGAADPSLQEEVLEEAGRWWKSSSCFKGSEEFF